MKNIIAQAYAMGQLWMELTLKGDHKGAEAVSERLDMLQDTVTLVGTMEGSERGYSDQFPIVAWEASTSWKCCFGGYPEGTELYAIERSSTVE